jgi:hypothetical protein
MSTLQYASVASIASIMSDEMIVIHTTMERLILTTTGEDVASCKIEIH